MMERRKTHDLTGQKWDEFEHQIDNETKIVVKDFSLKCSCPDWIAVKILRNADGWKQIGTAKIVVQQNLKEAEWDDIQIRNWAFDHQFRNRGIRSNQFRNIGIGSKVVQFMLDYMRKNRIEKVHGKISREDDAERAVNFWKKNGFSITMYDKPKGRYVAGIYKTL